MTARVMASLGEERWAVTGQGHEADPVLLPCALFTCLPGYAHHLIIYSAKRVIGATPECAVAAV